MQLALVFVVWGGLMASLYGYLTGDYSLVGWLILAGGMAALGYCFTQRKWW